MSIRTKFILILVAFIVIPGLLFSMVVYSTAKASLFEIRMAQLNSVALLKKDKIETYFDAWKATVRSMQVNPDIRQYLPLLISSEQNKDSETYRIALRELKGQIGELRTVHDYLSIMLTDARGRILIATTSLAGERLDAPSLGDYLHAAKKTIVFSDVYRRSSSDGKLAMIAAAPVLNEEGLFIGVVIVEQAMDTIYRSLMDTTGLGETGEVLVSRKEGAAVLFLSPLKKDPQAIFKMTVSSHDDRGRPAWRAARGENGSGIEFDYAGSEVLASWQYIPMLRWGLVTKIETSEAFAPAIRMRNLIIVLGIVVLMLGVFVAIAIARGITEPIVQLQKGTEIIGHGDLNHKVRTQANDEVGDLSRMIDAMTENLKKVTSSRDELNAEIAVRREAEESLHRSVREIEDLYNNAPCGYHSLDADGLIIKINDTELNGLGYAREEIVGKKRLTDLMTAESVKLFEKVFPQFKERGVASDIEYDLIRKDGRIMSVLLSASAVRDTDGTFLMSRTTLYDITERTEVARRSAVTNALVKLFTEKIDRKEYLDAVVEHLRGWSGFRHVGIRITDENNNIPYVSCVGFGAEFMRSENMLSLDSDNCACIRIIAGKPEPQDRPAMTANGSFVLNNSKRYVEGLRKPEQERFRGVCVSSGYTSIAIIPVRHGDRVLGALHFADEREGIASESTIFFIEQLAYIIGEAIYRFGVEEERARLVSAVASAAEAVVITNPATGVIVYANPAFEQMTGYEKDEIIGRTLHFLESGKLGEEFYAGLRESLAKDGVWNGRLINRRKNGALYYEDCTVSPVKDSKGEIVNYVYIKRDVTDKLRFEAIAESVNTMDNIGYVFSGVRHEIGNPINSINMILGLLRAKQAVLKPEAVREYLAKMTEQVARVEYILHSLKSFNLYETQEPQDLDLPLFMESFLPLIRDDLGKKGIAIETVVEPGMSAFADPRALQQVLLNIVTNAADAVNGRENPVIAITLSRTSGSVQIRIKDNGQGIPEDKIKDVFKPFYTTKKHGTGLGLVIVQKMLARMNGRLDLASTLGKGTTVDITLQEAKRDHQ